MFNPACGGNVAYNRFTLLLQEKVCAFRVWTVLGMTLVAMQQHQYFLC